jgi:hypothetical protein
MRHMGKYRNQTLHLNSRGWLRRIHSTVKMQCTSLMTACIRMVFLLIWGVTLALLA